MSHLIVGTTEKFDLHEMLDKLCAAHKYLAEHGARALTRAEELGRSEKWGQSVKRIRVELPSDGRPELAKWCLLQASKFSDGLGLVCHPTTSSRKSNQDHDDHDLVVRDANGRLGYFEVSDVVSDRDGNNKEGEALVRLRLLRSVRRVADKRGTFEHDGIDWPDERLVLVVSEEFAKYLCDSKKSWRKNPDPHIRYEDPSQRGPTRVLEILPGNR